MDLRHRPPPASYRSDGVEEIKQGPDDGKQTPFSRPATYHVDSISPDEEESLSRRIPSRRQHEP